MQVFAKSTSQKGDAMRTLRNVKRREGTRTGLFYRLFSTPNPEGLRSGPRDKIRSPLTLLPPVKCVSQSQLQFCCSLAPGAHISALFAVEKYELK